jgi:hypothetical protein
MFRRVLVPPFMAVLKMEAADCSVTLVYMYKNTQHYMIAGHNPIVVRTSNLTKSRVWVL